MAHPATPIDIAITAPDVPRQEEIITPEALEFILALHNATHTQRQELLQRRQERRRDFANGKDPKFLPETQSIREDTTWQVAPPAPGLTDRRVEITAPARPDAAVTALNSGADVWLADFEDSLTPTWENLIGGQLTLKDAIAGTLIAEDESGAPIRPVSTDLTQLPTIAARGRGWHLPEKHLLINGTPISGAIFDFGLYFFHNARRLIEQGRGPYFYLPKLEDHLEARLWNDTFVLAQNLLGIPQGTIRATTHIETITAAFEMEEILYELREHSGGLNAGRWDYIFSIIKNFRARGPRFVLPDRAAITMSAPFMQTYMEQLVRAAHRRGAHAIGGMSNFIAEGNSGGGAETSTQTSAASAGLAGVHADKTREVQAGFDGSWVSHPSLVDTARAAFEAQLGTEPNQLTHQREDVQPSDRALIDISGTQGKITEAGVRTNIDVGIRYLESWLRGRGAVPLDNLLEDVSTAEISRSQIWQWLNAEAVTDAGEIVSPAWVRELMDEEFAGFTRHDGDRYDDARAIFEEIALGEHFPTFLTVPAYARYLHEARELAAA